VTRGVRQQPERGGLLGGAVEQAAGKRGGARLEAVPARGRVGDVQPVQHALDRRLHAREEQGVLGAAVGEQRRLGDARAPGDVRRRGAVQPVGGERVGYRELVEMGAAARHAAQR
jgi:hypothetical protein